MVKKNAQVCNPNIVKAKVKFKWDRYNITRDIHMLAFDQLLNGIINIYGHTV